MWVVTHSGAMIRHMYTVDAMWIVTDPGAMIRHMQLDDALYIGRFLDARAAVHG